MFSSVLSNVFHIGHNIKKREDEAYYDVDFSLVRYDRSITFTENGTKRSNYNPKSELEFVTAQNSRVLLAGEPCYLVDAQWLSNWYAYVSGDASFVVKEEIKEGVPAVASHPVISIKHPGNISNHSLCDEFGRLLSNEVIQVKENFRPVHQYVWQYLFTRYGGGPVIIVYVPHGYSDKQYAAGVWMKDLSPYLHEIAYVIEPSPNPEKFHYYDKTARFLDSLSRETENIKTIQRKKDELSAIASIFAADAVSAEETAVQQQLSNVTGEIAKQNAFTVIESLSTAVVVDKLISQAHEEEEMVHNIVMEETLVNIANLWRPFERISDLNLVHLPEEEKQKKVQELAARMIQFQYKKFKRSQAVAAAIQRAHKLKLEAYARKLQTKWRIVLARRLLEKKRLEKYEYLRGKCQIQISKFYRKYRARVQFNKIHEERVIELQQIAEENRIKAERKVKLERSTSVVYHFLLRYVARHRLKKLIAVSQQHAVIIQLQSLKFGTDETSNVFVKVACSRAMGKIYAVKPKGVPQKTISMFTSKSHSTVDNVCDFENELVVLSGVLWTDYLVLNVYEKSGLKDHLIGQIELTIRNYPTIFSSLNGGKLQLSLPLGKKYVDIHDANGNIISVNEKTGKTGKSAKNKDILSLCIRYPRLAYERCGWIYKMSSTVILGKPVSYKRRWFLLLEGTLQYFDDPFNLEDPRYVIALTDVINIEYENKEGSAVVEVMKIQFGTDEWKLKFMEDEDELVRNDWIRKIVACCPNIGNKTLKRRRTSLNLSKMLSSAGIVSAGTSEPTLLGEEDTQGEEGPTAVFKKSGRRNSLLTAGKSLLNKGKSLL